MWKQTLRLKLGNLYYNLKIAAVFFFYVIIVVIAILNTLELSDFSKMCSARYSHVMVCTVT